MVLPMRPEPADHPCPACSSWISPLTGVKPAPFVNANAATHLGAYQPGGVEQNVEQRAARVALYIFAHMACVLATCTNTEGKFADLREPHADEQCRFPHKEEPDNQRPK